MTKKTVLLSCCLLFIVGALSAWFLTNRSMHDTQVCSATIFIYKDDIRANLTLDFMYTLQKKTGVVAVSGTYAQGDKTIGAIRRDVSYSWEENNDTFHFLSQKVTKIYDGESLPDEKISEILPDFFVYPDSTVHYSIINQGDKGFMFTVGKRPVFFCSR